jgi:hypothetical protein
MVKPLVAGRTNDIASQSATGTFCTMPKGTGPDKGLSYYI